MQLDQGRKLKAKVCIRQIYSLDGVRGFYRGLSASYAGEYLIHAVFIAAQVILFTYLAGTCETAIHFVIYEHFKKMLRQRNEELSPLECTGAAGVAKFTASILCYPHGKDNLSLD